MADTAGATAVFAAASPGGPADAVALLRAEALRLAAGAVLATE